MENHRIGRVTSSSIAEIMGMSPYGTPLTAWERITGRYEVPSSKAMERGTALESAVLKWCASKVATSGGYTEGKTVFDPDDGRLADTPDAYVWTTEGRRIVEAKTVAQGGESKWGVGIPEHVWVQCQWHLMFDDSIDCCLVPVLFGGFNFRFELYEAPRSEQFIVGMRAAAIDFLDRFVETDERPPVTNMVPQAESDALDRILGGEGALESHHYISELARKYCEESKLAKAAYARKMRLGNLIKAELDGYDSCDTKHHTITYRDSGKGKRLVVKEKK